MGGTSVAGVHPVAQALIDHFRMTPLPVEGTFFVSTYRSPADTPDGGPVGTASASLRLLPPAARRWRFPRRLHARMAAP